MRKILALLIVLAIPAVAQFGGPMGGMRPGSMQGGGLLPGRGGDPLWVAAGPTKPKLDLDFAKRKDLTDAVSGKTSLVTFSRSAAQSPGTYVGSDGLIHDAAVNLALYSEQFDLWTNANSVDAANQIASPDGKQTADKLIESGVIPSGTNARVVYSLSGFSASTVHSFSIFAKKAERNFLYLGVGGGGLANGEQGWFDLDSGTTGSTLNGAVLSIENVGNGWYRCSMQITTTGTSGTVVVGLALSDGGLGGYTGDGTSGIYLWGAQLEETDPATMAPTAYIHTTSQALAAPRFDHTPTTGNLTTNLVKYSEFQSGWSSTNITKTLQAATDPFGGTSATKLEATGGIAQFYQAYPDALVGQKYRWSVYAKALNSDFLRMGVYDSSFGWSNLTDINIADGTSPDGATITDAGNGWYRVEVLTGALVAAGAVPYFFVTSDISGATATGGESILLYGAQFEATESPAGPYVRTLGESRSISDAVAPSLGLLVEEQRANLETQSVSLLNYDNNASATTNSTVTLGQSDPWGGTNAGLFEGDGSGTSYSFGVVKSSADTETFSVWLKAGTTSLARIQIGAGATTQGVYAVVDLSAGTIGPATLVGGSFTAISSSIQAWGNGWYRCSVSAASPAGNHYAYVTFPSANTTDNYYFAAPQWEVGSFPTSYIPTNGSAQTRYADIAAVQDEDFSTTNLLAYSESFDVGWSTTRLRPVVSNAATAPDGTLTADYIEQEAGQTNAGAVLTSRLYTGQQIISVYAKAAEKNFLRVTDNITNTAWFDLQNGTVGTVTGTKPASIEDVGNGWYRCSVSTTHTGTANLLFYLAEADNSATVADSGGIYLWGASVTATEYPVEYTTTRNLLTDSQDFERSTWTKYQSGTGVAPAIVSGSKQAPDGTNTASEITFSAPASGDQTFIRQYPTVIASVEYTGGFYVKGEGANVGKTILFRHVGKSSFLSIVLTADWQRIERAETAFSSSQAFEIGLRPGINGTPTDTVTALFWGAQLEPGTTASDYVRTVDTVGKAYQWYEPTEGTVFVEGDADSASTGSLTAFGSSGAAIYKASPTSTSLARWWSGSDGVYSSTTADWTAGVSIGGAYEYASRHISMNGDVVSSVGTTISNAFNLVLGGGVGGIRPLNGHIKRLTYWPVRQSDSTLQVITQ